MIGFNLPSAPQGGQENGAAGQPPAPQEHTPARTAHYAAQGNVLIAYAGHDMDIRIPYAASADIYSNTGSDEEGWYDAEKHSFTVPHLLGEEFTRVLVSDWMRPGGGEINEIYFVSPKGRRKVMVQTSAGGMQETVAYLFENLPGGLWGMNFECGKVSEVPWAHGGDKITRIATETHTFTLVNECDPAQLCEQPKIPAHLYKGPPTG